MGAIQNSIQGLVATAGIGAAAIGKAVGKAGKNKDKIKMKKANEASKMKVDAKIEQQKQFKERISSPLENKTSKNLIEFREMGIGGSR